MNGYRLDGRHRWRWILLGPWPLTSGYWRQANNWFYQGAYECRVCGIRTGAA